MIYEDLAKLVRSFPAILRESGEEECYRAFTQALGDLSVERTTFTSERDQQELARFQRVMLPLVQESEFCGRVYEKPFGYAGDFVTQEMIWLGRTEGGTRRYAGSSEAGEILNSVTLDMDNSRANEERIYRLREVIGSDGGRLASVGCGSCIELWEVHEIRSDPLDLDIVLVDQDQRALDRARDRLSGLLDCSVQYHCQSVLKFVLRCPEVLRSSRDLVYAFGLLDYFPPPSAKRIVTGLWNLVAPGGRLLVTNAHPSNPTRIWMEYGGEWFLQYKNEETMQGLTADLQDVDVQTLRTDSLGVYQYLEVTRTA